jgi:hypothetical protein
VLIRKNQYEESKDTLRLQSQRPRSRMDLLHKETDGFLFY